MKDWEASYVAGIIDGEGSITLTRLHKNEFRRPSISIASTDIELLLYVHSLTHGNVYQKKNYNPNLHKDSYFLSIKNKKDVFYTLENISPFLRVEKKRNRANWILQYYNVVTKRNGKYNSEAIAKKLDFEKKFFEI